MREHAKVIAQLAAPVLFTPLTMTAHHFGILTRDYRLYVVSGLVLILLYVLSRVFGKLYSNRALGVSVAVVVGAVLLHGNQIARHVPGGLVVVAAILLLFLVLAYTAKRQSLVVALVGWLVVAMWLWIGAAWFGTLVDQEPSRLATGSIGPLEVREASSDVLILLVDEYPNADFLNEVEGGEKAVLEAWLKEEGFEVTDPIWASYSFTEYALPSFFMLQPPLRAGDTLSQSTRSDLLKVLGGDNPVVKSFKSAGYRTWMVESGWSGLRCMSPIDQCVKRSWYDEGMGVIVGRSVLADLVNDQLGRPFTHGVERSLAWIRSDLASVVGNGAKDLVIVHLMLPHQPLAFSDECERLEKPVSMEPSALLNQVMCANRAIQEFVSLAGSDAIILIMGDHGTDLRGQTETPVAEWDRDMVIERMRTMAAVRGLEGCSEPPPATTLNVFVRLMKCLGADVEYAPDLALATSVYGEPLVGLYPGGR